eukprot:Seg1577.9 transcript_id=Seg1577.9/GoldUCD/mRNA.D3Y31 product="hypothetical protein" protein_id=Seg1577.9/GoldUCD/D3Y31
MENPIAIEFSSWLRSAVGGGRVASIADQIVSRAFKYLRYCCDETEEDELDESTIDFCIGSTDHFIRFIELIEKDYDVGPSGRIGYINAVLELIDFRKCKGASYSMLQNFVKAEVCLKRSRKLFGKELSSNWSINLDIDTLEAKHEWATIEELQRVLPFHLPRYKDVLKKCKTTPKEVSLGELSSAT